MSKKTSEESVPVQEVKVSEKLSTRRFFRSIAVVFLSFVCICVGVIIYRIHTPLDRGDILPARRELRRQTSPASVDLVQHSLKIRPVDRKSIVTVPAPSMIVTRPIETPADEAVQLLSREPVEKNVPSPVPEIELPVVESVSEPMTPMLTLEEALQLRDQLGTGAFCLDSFQIVLKSRLPDEQQRTLLTERLMPICTTSSAFKELNTLFLKNKKDALMTYYRMTSSTSWLAYAKVVATSVVDIRRLSPTKQRPKDLISLAQTALNRYDVAEALGYVRQLPPQIAADFQEFVGQARAYVLAQAAVNQLVLSFDKKGK